MISLGNISVSPATCTPRYTLALFHTLAGIGVRLPNSMLNKPLLTGTALAPVRASVHSAAPPVGTAYKRKVMFALPVMGLPAASVRVPWYEKSLLEWR